MKINREFSPIYFWNFATIRIPLCRAFPMAGSPSLLRYAILGTGALGGYYGISLAAAGCDVQFVVRSDFDYVRQHGLKLDTIGKSIHPFPRQSRIEDLSACSL